eukprot:2764036-Prymnesium_polylepis.1
MQIADCMRPRQLTTSHPWHVAGVIILRKCDYTTSTQEGTVPHRDKPARIPWPSMCCACAVLVCGAGRAHL